MQLGKSGIKQNKKKFNIFFNLRKNILVIVIIIVLIFIIQLWFIGLILDYFKIFIKWISDLFYKIKNKKEKLNV